MADLAKLCGAVNTANLAKVCGVNTSALSKVCGLGLAPTIALIDSNTGLDTMMRLSGCGGSYTATAWGQAFTLSSAKTITSVVFSLCKYGSPSGSNIVARLYAATGTMGSTATPTGSVLATSDGVAPSSLSAYPTMADTTFTFSTQYSASAADYCVVVDWSGGDTSNNVRVGVQNYNKTHSGNLVDYVYGWYAQSAYDSYFKLYGY